MRDPDHLIAVTPTANAQGCLNGPACTESPNTWIPRERGRRLRLGPGELPYEVRDMGYESPCWIWRRPLARGGYPRHYLRADEVPPGGRREVYAHRHYYESNVGPIPPGLVLDHLCNNPPCVNPAHLEPVTAKENMRRKTERQRRASIALFAAPAAG